MKLHWIFNRYMRPADDGASGGGGGGATDRGDDFTPTGPDAEAAADEAAAAEAKKTVAAEAAAEAAEAAAAEAAATEAEAEAAEAAAAEEGKDKTKSKARIPLDRHEAILNKERERSAALAAQLAQFQGGEKVAALNDQVAAADTKIVALEKEYAELVADGKATEAAAVMATIRRTERESAAAQNDAKIQAAVAVATESARYNIALERVEAAYPVLNPDHADYDEDLQTDVADLKMTYQRRGMTPTAALQKAVERLVKATTAKQEAAVDVTPKVDPKDVKTDPAAIAADRKKEAVAKALKATGATPPSTADIGMDSDKAGGAIDAKSVIKMNFKDFSKLGEEELSRMRGDTI